MNFTGLTRNRVAMAGLMLALPLGFSAATRGQAPASPSSTQPATTQSGSAQSASDPSTTAQGAQTPAVQTPVVQAPAAQAPAATPATGVGTPPAAGSATTAAAQDASASDKTGSDKSGSDQTSADKAAADKSGDDKSSADATLSAKGCADDPETGKNPCGAPKMSKKDQDAAKAAAKAPTPVLVEPGSQLETKIKPGSIEDVSAVGNRDIGGRGMGNWYSTDSEIRMGRQYAAEIEKSTRFITDPVVTEYVNRIGQNIVKNSDCKVPFTIKVIDSDEINAMALPGGFFYVNSGLILNADEEAELAGVMAHETAHVCAHHAAREMTRANYAQIGMIPLIFVGGWTGYGIYEAAQIAVPMTFLHFSRDFEAQADYLGVQYMYRAGYDPQAFISFFEKVQALEKRKPGLVAKAFSDHPQTPDRIEHSQNEIAHILPAKDEYTVTTSEFDDVKARLARIENKRRLTDGKDGKKPSLRKASAKDDSNSNSTAQTNPNSTSPDDQPTLHRREDNN